MPDQEGFGSFLYQARETAREQILKHTEALRHDLERLELMLQRPAPILNTLGELQGRPAMVEAAVGEFAAADKALSRYLDYLKTLPAGEAP